MDAMPLLVLTRKAFYEKNVGAARNPIQVGGGFGGSTPT